MNNITQKEYNYIIGKNNELIDLIILRTKEFSNIIYDRDPIGVCDETDFDVRDGSMLVQFCESLCGELSVDSFYIPLEFLFSKEYRENYVGTIMKIRLESEE